MADKNNKKNILIILLVLILGVGLFMYFKTPNPNSSEICAGNCNSQFSPSSSSLSNLPFLKVELYDANGNIINYNLPTQSVVNGVEGVTSIGVTATASNTGSTPLTCVLMGLNPSAFNTAMDKSAKTVAVGGITTWSSSAITTASLGTGTFNFVANLSCTYNLGAGIQTLANKTGSFTLIIAADGSASVNFGLDVPLASNWCGDNICNNASAAVNLGEDFSNCPVDCAAAVSNIKFRTTDNTYNSGSSIAVNTTATCGGALSAYTLSNVGTWGYGGCASYVSGKGNLIYNIPTTTAYTYAKLYKATALSGCAAGSYFVALERTDGYCFLNCYATAGGSVSTNIVSTSNPSLEVTC